ncbi:MAG: VOC family protein [Actinomycetota bacterium]
MTATESPTTRLYPDTGERPRPDLRPNGVNHLALATRDMKAQLQFWGDVLGCPTKALYWMHGVEGCFHGFVELAPESYVAFVQSDDNPTEAIWGVTHAGNAADAVTVGTMQHVAFNVDTLDELLTMRDRIRSRGVQVMGPIDHGMIKSIYFAGPEHLSLEISVGRAIDAEQWIDPEVQELCGISDAELAALKEPATFDRPDEPVPQPDFDESQPSLHYPPAVLRAIMGMSDADMWTNVSFPTPPVPPAD